METWPSTYTISKVVREMPPANPSRFLGVRFLPLNTQDFLDTQTIRYDQYGPHRGMIPAHSLDTDPALLKGETLATKSMPTRYWKGARRINESDILRVRNLGPQFQTLQRDRLVTRAMNAVKLAVDVRMEYSRWLALNEGFAAFSEDGVTFAESYGLPSVSTATTADWDEFASATPVDDVIEELVNFRGLGVTRVDMVINGKAANWLARNQDFIDRFSQSIRAADVGPGKIAQTFLECAGGGDSLLKAVHVYDEGYVNSSGTWTPFVSDDRCYLIGSVVETAPADNEFPAEDMLGEWASTPAVRDGLDDVSPGMFAIPEDETRTGNPYYDITAGIYGMPVIYQPNWVRRINIKQT